MSESKQTITFREISLLASFACEMERVGAPDDDTRKALASLHDKGLIVSEKEGYRPTPKGMAWINYVAKLPLPKQQWSMGS